MLVRNKNQSHRYRMCCSGGAIEGRGLSLDVLKNRKQYPVDIYISVYCSCDVMNNL